MRAICCPLATAWPDCEPRERVFCQVPVESEEGRRVGRRVTQDDRGPVVEALGVVSEAVNRAVERREHRRSRGQEQVDAEVDRAPLAARPLERVAQVDESRLVVASDPDRCSDLPHPAFEAPAHGCRIAGHLQALELGAADAQIEDELGAAARDREPRRARAPVACVSSQRASGSVSGHGSQAAGCLKV